MINKMATKAIWVMVREETDVKEVKISSEPECSTSYVEDRRILLQSLCLQLGIVYSPDKVYKFRNGRGSLVVLNRSMTPNTIASPFILEICETHKTAEPGQKQAFVVGNSKTCQRKFESMSKRVERLENMIPDLPMLREEKLTNEMKDVESRLSFLNERMKEAESQEWKGMFKKHPLW
ncbi:uncharacterized protein LOC110251848 [Exaiptasia diaphana]|uniref:Uncharacterized protein n=1 Tax=Exaiptasia diaphana TaxID=2652724 RepID=A0A913Y4F7_EXADI|nr:uncharacterized protein LOC110251848 [Exaiptasia diaphana]